MQAEAPVEQRQHWVGARSAGTVGRGTLDTGQYVQTLVGRVESVESPLGFRGGVAGYVASGAAAPSPLSPPGVNPCRPDVSDP